MFDWLVRAVNKLLEDHPSEEEKDFWSLFEQKMARGPYFVPFAKLLEKFELEELFKLSKKLERKRLIDIGRHGIYTTKEGDGILKRLHPSNSLKLPTDGRNTENFVINTDDIRRLFRPDDE
ncbi:MAG: hypothetical protein ACK5UY_04980 [Holosporales bacterium]